MCLTVVYDEFTPFYFTGIDTGTASSALLKREDHQQDAASPRWWPWPAAAGGPAHWQAVVCVGCLFMSRFFHLPSFFLNRFSLFFPVPEALSHTFLSAKLLMFADVRQLMVS